MPTELTDYTTAQLAQHNQMQALAARCIRWDTAFKWQLLDPSDETTVLASTTLSTQAQVDEMQPMIVGFASLLVGIAAVAAQGAIDAVTPGTLGTASPDMGDVKAANAIKTGSDEYELSVPGETGTLVGGLSSGSVTLAEAGVIAAVDLIRDELNEFAVIMENEADDLINPSESPLAPPPGASPAVPEDGVVSEAEVARLTREAADA